MAKVGKKKKKRCGNSCGSEMLSERAARGSVNRPAETVRGSDPECLPWFIHSEKFDKGRIYTKRKLAHGAIFFKSNKTKKQKKESSYIT